MPKIRVLIVDDTAVIRKLISEAISRDPDLEVAGTASNGSIALQKLPQLAPDAVTLDLEMPGIDGLETLRQLRRAYPKTPVIMLSSLTVKGAEATLEALAAGANDYVAKPAGSTSFEETLRYLDEELVPRIKAHFPTHSRTSSPDTIRSVSANQPATARRSVRPGNPLDRVEIVTIGTSTGGPNALTSIFTSITTPLPVPIVIVQHMPPIFTRSLAARLDSPHATRFFEAEDGQEILSGCAYIAPGGKHLEITRSDSRTFARLHEGPRENSCRPAVDVLFRSVAQHFGTKALAIVLTGMGKDGYRGAQSIVELGGRVLAQDKASSVVWGMPSYIAEEGIAEEVLPLTEIANNMRARIISPKGRSAPTTAR